MDEFECAEKRLNGLPKTTCDTCRAVINKEDVMFVTDGRELLIEVCERCASYYIRLKESLEK